MRVHAMLAAAAALIGSPSFAVAVTGSARGSSGDAAAAFYVRARAADAAGMLDVAAKGYAAALDVAPGDEVLALRAYRQAMQSGDEPLALRAAGILAAKGALPPDARLLLVARAVKAKDWPAARIGVEGIEKDDVFTFLAPVLRGWIAFGAGDKDPLARLADPGKGGTLAIAYTGEHRALMLLALGQKKDGIAAIQALGATSGGRAGRLRLAAAAELAKQGDRAAALAMVAGTDDVFAAARAIIQAGGALPGAVDDAPAGIAELLVRVAIDINRERPTPLGLSLTRLATFLAPDNSETWLAAAGMLAGADHPDAALAALAHIPAGDPAAEPARLVRLQLLVRKGEQQEALTEARAAAARPGATLADLTRVGDLLNDLDRPREAADAYTRALDVASRNPDLADQRWTILMLRGGALDAAKDWTAARTDLQQAVKLAPDQAVALNYLGYAQLERRENLAEAEKLIERASALQPDDAAITDSLGWTYFLRGDVPKAIVTLERAVAGQPGEPTINEHLGDAYWTAGRRYEARYAWRAALVYAEAKDAARLRTKLDGGLSAESAAP